MLQGSFTLSVGWLFSVSSPPQRGVRLRIEDGRLVEIEITHSPGDLHRPDHLAIPGLVNLHTHLDLSGAKGQFPPSRNFTDWLKQVIAFRRSQTPEQIQTAIQQGIQELIANGTSLVGDINVGGTSLDLIQASPLSAVLFRECLGLSDEAAIRADHEWSSWLNTKTRSVQPGISPHAPYSVGRKLLEQVHARRGPLAIHFAEFPDETELLESGRGLLRDFLESLGVWNEAALFNSHREILNHLTSTGPKLLVHANHLDPQIPLPPDSSIVYCPRTHAAFGHAPHPFRELLAAGHRVVLGTDSLASNPDLDVLREAAFLHQQHPDFPSEKLLRMVTLDAAEAIHDRRFGTIEIGSPVDLVLLPITGSASDPYSLLWDAARSEEGRERIMDNR